MTFDEFVDFCCLQVYFCIQVFWGVTSLYLFFSACTLIQYLDQFTLESDVGRM